MQSVFFLPCLSTNVPCNIYIKGRAGCRLQLKLPSRIFNVSHFLFHIHIIHRFITLSLFLFSSTHFRFFIIFFLCFSTRISCLPNYFYSIILAWIITHFKLNSCMLFIVFYKLFVVNIII